MQKNRDKNGQFVKGHKANREPRIAGENKMRLLATLAWMVAAYFCPKWANERIENENQSPHKI